MRNGWRKSVIALIVCVAIAAGVTALAAGCGGGNGQPKVMVFLGKSSKSYDAMKPVVDSLQKKFKDKVNIVVVDYDDPKNKGEIDKYHVSMNPTVIIFNTQGQIKETYMGAAREDMLSGSIESFIPGKKASTSTQPGTVTTPATPVPPSGTSSMPSNLPGTTP
jgi:hypothetical protein